MVALMSAFTVFANHPWLKRVYEYRPAPGQFINTMPVCRVGEPVDSVLARCQASIGNVAGLPADDVRVGRQQPDDTGHPIQPRRNAALRVFLRINRRRCDGALRALRSQ